ncbi:FAD binding domain-containing protein [Saccharopolyspora phatthalungensis]|uniref:Carbon-monoxide dehydrogenase medium subunit n=1 Tax=Saccharopolyspora phatthalungensis TaxID=664693 RepID=A0A840QIM3_9PSEU|nr:FAD binding domain-containing protein [Saccharopolyspora phatthalungensis]MBB5158599.1 carbon-monoxide dehydrogenase medium subunit [Saccharopolyspora phatthalungensis]
MKAAPFAYVRPATLDEAVSELVRADGGGKVIAGGQSLVPVLAMRLARPTTLVDINAVPELGELRADGGRLEVGATVRQRRIERAPEAASVPLLRMALPWVGHRELRSRGTVCGSLAHADPAAEIPAVASCLNAELDLVGPRGRRTVAAREFFAGAMATALEGEDVLAAVRFPTARPGDGFGFAEIARRHGDFALAGVAAHVRVAEDRVVFATLTAFGVSDRPVTREVADLLSLAAAAQDVPTELQGPLSSLAVEVVNTDGDVHASTEYRRRLFRTLAARELAKAYRRATESSQR